ncbi:MAG TPA: tyrosine-type recombinase/integrase [Pirellulales bacterium]|nr:tyrosine-type recombinase/integrase [Pirellulales bacterium]
MASIHQRNEAWYGQFLYRQQRHTVALGKISQRDATEWRLSTEQILQKIKEGWIEVPDGMPITEFIEHGGKPPAEKKAAPKNTTLAQLREKYVDTFSNGAIEKNSLYTATLHLKQIEKTLGGRFLLSGLSMASLQGHIDRRQATVGPVTIRKEVNSFRAAFNWGKQMELVQGTFPSAGLVYPKGEEKLPFMTWAEIERRIKAGGDPDGLWEALYLDADQIEEFLKHAKAKKLPKWAYPMLATAAFTGARRSELLRVKQEDVDLADQVLTIKEKKRQRGTRTTRRVPITKKLAAALRPLMKDNRGYLFGDGDEPLSIDRAHCTFKRITANSKWAKVRGYHVLRHSLCSIAASSGTDQRLIDSWLGHSTEQQRKRYRHLFPQVQQAAISKLFA